jgi:hypothetical protein
LTLGGVPGDLLQGGVARDSNNLVRSPGASKADFLREAIEAEVERRERESRVAAIEAMIGEPSLLALAGFSSVRPTDVPGSRRQLSPPSDQQPYELDAAICQLRTHPMQ